MAEVNGPSVTKFLTKCWQYPPASDEIAKVIVEHMGSTKNQEIYSREVDSKSFNPDGISFEVCEAMTEDAEGLGGIQKYAIKVYFGKRKTPQIKRLAVDARTDTVDDEFSEPANTKGLVSQLMRHNEAATRLALGGAAQNQKMLLDTIRELREENAQLRKERQEYLAEREELQTKRHERELEVRLVDSQEKRKDQMVEELKLLLPVALQKLNLPKLLPGGDSKAGDDAATMLVASRLMDSLKPAQVAQIAGALRPEQQTLFLEFSQRVKASDSSGAMEVIPKLVDSLSPAQIAQIAGALEQTQQAAFLTLAQSVQKKG